MSGKHSHRNGFMNNGNSFDWNQQIFPKILRAAGYLTALYGKSHLKGQAQGFDSWAVLPGQGDYYNPVMLTPEGRKDIPGDCTDMATGSISIPPHPAPHPQFVAGKTLGFFGRVAQPSPMLRVNGEWIDQELVEETFHRIKTGEEQRLEVSCCERDPEFYEQAEQEVADSILIAQEAEKRFPEIPEEEITPKLKEMIDTYREHGASWDMLEAQRDMMRHEIAASLRMDKLIADLLGNDNAVTEEEVQAFYQERLNEYRSPAEARSLHLMKTLNENTTADEVFSKLLALREKALDGADFEEMAKGETEKSTGEIDLGWIPLDRPTNPFEATLFSMRTGEVSPVIVYEHAMHLIKVVQRKEEEIVPFEEVREELENRALGRKRRDRLQMLAHSLRETALIEKVEPGSDGEDS